MDKNYVKIRNNKWQKNVPIVLKKIGTFYKKKKLDTFHI